MPGRSVYATMLNDAGKFVDDCVMWTFLRPYTSISPALVRIARYSFSGSPLL